MPNSPIIVENARVDDETLTRLLNDVQRLTGAKVTVRLRQQWVVECDNYPVSLALQTLLGGTPEFHANRKIAKPSQTQADFKLSKKGMELHEKHKQKKPGAPTEPQQLKAWRLMDGETVLETMTTDEKNIALAKGVFQEGAILHHPKIGKQRVIGSGPGQGMEPVQ